MSRIQEEGEITSGKNSQRWWALAKGKLKLDSQGVGGRAVLILGGMGTEH